MNGAYELEDMDDNSAQYPWNAMLLKKYYHLDGRLRDVEHLYEILFSKEWSKLIKAKLSKGHARTKAEPIKVKPEANSTKAK
ncbi:hypothetical protein ACS0TY_026559 [Phlomoides rotata]